MLEMLLHFLREAVDGPSQSLRKAAVPPRHEWNRPQKSYQAPSKAVG